METKKTSKPHQLYGLYAITPDSGTFRLTNAELLQRVEQALQGGARVLQYRDKFLSPEQQFQQASALKALCDSYNVHFIINDDVELTRAVRADGVHLGRDDAPLAEARHILGETAIIGVSCYNQLDRAHAAQQRGADYVAFGRFFPSRSKPDASPADIDLLLRARSEVTIPIVCIGGINADNAKLLVDAGADMVAVINSVFTAADVTYAARQLSALFIKREVT